MLIAPSESALSGLLALPAAPTPPSGDTGFPQLLVAALAPAAAAPSPGWTDAPPEAAEGAGAIAAGAVSLVPQPAPADTPAGFDTVPPGPATEIPEVPSPDEESQDRSVMHPTVAALVAAAIAPVLLALPAPSSPALSTTAAEPARAVQGGGTATSAAALAGAPTIESDFDTAEQVGAATASSAPRTAPRVELPWDADVTGAPGGPVPAASTAVPMAAALAADPTAGTGDPGAMPARPASAPLPTGAEGTALVAAPADLPAPGIGARAAADAEPALAPEEGPAAPADAPRLTFLSLAPPAESLVMDPARPVLGPAVVPPAGGLPAASAGRTPPAAQPVASPDALPPGQPALAPATRAAEAPPTVARPAPEPSGAVILQPGAPVVEADVGPVSMTKAPAIAPGQPLRPEAPVTQEAVRPSRASLHAAGPADRPATRPTAAPGVTTGGVPATTLPGDQAVAGAGQAAAATPGIESRQPAVPVPDGRVADTPDAASQPPDVTTRVALPGGPAPVVQVQGTVAGDVGTQSVRRRFALLRGAMPDPPVLRVPPAPPMGSPAATQGGLPAAASLGEGAVSGRAVPADAAEAASAGDAPDVSDPMRAAFAPAAAAAGSPDAPAAVPSETGEQRPAPALEGPAHQIVSAARMHLRGEGGTIEMHLDPPELGRVRLQVSLEDGRLTAFLATETTAARDALESQAGAMRQALHDRGLSVQSLQVGLDLSPGNRGGHQPPQEESLPPRWGAESRPPASPPAPARSAPAPARRGGIDYLA